jgi:hypothetical protein
MNGKRVAQDLCLWLVKGSACMAFGAYKLYTDPSNTYTFQNLQTTCLVVVGGSILGLILIVAFTGLPGQE